MESNFSGICRRIANYFADLADAYEEDIQNTKARLDFCERELANNYETKRKILVALQEELNGIQSN